MSLLFGIIKEGKMAIEGADLVKAAAFLGAGIAMGLGAIGPGVGEGFVGGFGYAARYIGMFRSWQ